MKRNLLISTLVLAIIFSTVGCQKEPAIPEESSSSEEVTESVSETETESEEEIETETEVSEEVISSAEEVSEEPEEIVFTEEEIDKEFLVKAETELRDKPSFKGVRTGVILNKGDKVKAVGVVNGQWYHIKGEENEGYANVAYLSEQLFIVTDMEATMYAKQKCNIRKGPETTYEKAGSLSLNEEVTVTGKTDNNWYRISYNGEDAYVSASMLSNEKVAEKPKENTSASGNGGSGNGGNSGSGNTTTPSNDDDPFDFVPENTCYADTAALDYINKLRREAGVPELVWESSAEADCMARARAMKDNQRVDHGLNGGVSCGENLTKFAAFSTKETARASINAYANSSAHYANMVDPHYTSVCSASCFDDLDIVFNVLWLF